MKKTGWLILATIMIVFLTTPTASALWSGKKLRYAQERATRVERTEYVLRLWGVEILTWNSDEATPNFTGMPAGQYTLSAIKKQGNEISFYAYTYFDIPSAERPILVFILEENTDVNLIITDLPENFSHDNLSQHNVRLTGPNGSAWGNGVYIEDTNSLHVTVWTNVFLNYTLGVLVDRNNNPINVSLPDIDLVSASLTNTSVEIRFEELTIEHESPINERYAHNRWLKEGIEDKIEHLSQILSYSQEAEEGDILRIKVSGGRNPEIDVLDTLVRVTNSAGELMLTGHPRIRPDGWVDDTYDFGPHGTLYEDIRFVVPADDTYIIFVKAYSPSRTGKFNLRVDNPENW